ncbi:MAG: SMC-Scp complex subunit ScpB [Kiritimatiellae bacterium]|nr:SMC-Scp complex subunit ScpB [Kiritimatiellia bacterium]
MWNPDADRDVPLRAIAGALVLGADHPVTAAEVHQVVETVETLRRAQSADAPDVTDAELEAAQAEADVAAGRTVGAIPKAEAEAAATAARAEIEKREEGAKETPPAKICPPSEVRAAMDEVRRALEAAGLGFELVETNGGFRFRTSADCGPWVRQMLGKGRATVLSRPAVETLAIVAWRQPVSRSQIENIRGVNAGHVIKALMEMQLVRIIGRSDQPGRPFLFGTTPEFLAHFGLKSLDDLASVSGAEELVRDDAPSKKKPAAQPEQPSLFVK